MNGVLPGQLARAEDGGDAQQRKKPTKPSKLVKAKKARVLAIEMVEFEGATDIVSGGIAFPVSTTLPLEVALAREEVGSTTTNF